jgi:hypothetical protein
MFIYRDQKVSSNDITLRMLIVSQELYEVHINVYMCLRIKKKRHTPYMKKKRLYNNFMKIRTENQTSESFSPLKKIKGNSNNNNKNSHDHTGKTLDFCFNVTFFLYLSLSRVCYFIFHFFFFLRLQFHPLQNVVYSMVCIGRRLAHTKLNIHAGSIYIITNFTCYDCSFGFFFILFSSFLSPSISHTLFLSNMSK